MYIRDVHVDRGLVLAPMEGVTDLTFRRLIRHVGGAGMVFTEFIPAKGLAQNIERCRETAKFDPDQRPVAIQVYGRDPGALADGARAAQELGADVVDLNMGCPSKKVCKNSGGSSLMREPLLVRDIVRAMRAAVSIPFTVKMRSGWDVDSKNAPELAVICVEEGAEAVTVHWRTRTDLYGGDRELDTVAAVKQAVDVPVLFNGDIIDAASAAEALAYTGCDGLMIGRGAIRNPWVFREIRHALYGEPAVVPDATEKERVLMAYYAELRTRFRSDKGTLGRMKKIARYFTQGLPHGDALKMSVFHSQSIAEAEAALRTYFDRLRRYEAGHADAFETAA